MTMKSDNKEKESKARREIFWGSIGIILTIALIILGIYLNNRFDLESITHLGLLGMFVFAFIASSIFSLYPMPLPYWIVTLWLPALLAPYYGIWAAVWVMLVTAIGATLGQFITFMIGYGGRSSSQKKLTQRFSPQIYEEASEWIKRIGSKAVFWMTLIPNPINLPMTIAVALLKYPPYKFLFYSFAGLLIRSAILAFSGFYFWDIVGGWVESYIDKGLTGSPFFTVILVLVGIILTIAVWQLIIWMLEIKDKNNKYLAAVSAAKESGKPLLVVGGPWGIKAFRRLLNKPAHGEGDVCLDIDRRAIEGHPCAIVASCTNIPFGDNTFGAVFSSHVLEHMPNTQTAKQALAEMKRVAKSVFIAYPSKQSIAAWLIKDHHIWIWQRGDKTLLKQRKDKDHKGHYFVETTDKND